MRTRIFTLTICLILYYTNIFSQEYPKSVIKISNQTFREDLKKNTENSPKEYLFPSVFLKGNYVQVGIHPAASFGCDIWTPIPEDYDSTWTFWSNPSITDYIVGFNCDIQKDGYTVGTPPYMGDYFVPGAPLEGWVIEWNNSTLERTFLNFGAIADYAGSDYFQVQVLNFENKSTPDMQMAEWLGEAVFDENEKLQIKKNIKLGNDDTYFTIEVTMTNTGTIPLESVEYMRQVDPDNEFIFTAFMGMEPVTQSDSSYCTFNYVTHQPGVNGNADTAKVYAEGTTFRAPLILGTIDPRAKVTVGGAVNLGELLFDPDEVLDSPNEPTYETPQYGDYQIGLAFRLGTLQPGECVSFIYYYNMVELENQQIVFPITAQFDYSIDCLGNVDFYDTSFGIGANSILSWQWDCDNDGTFETSGQNTSFQFIATGIYPVTLQVEMCDGTIHEVTNDIIIENIFQFDLEPEFYKCEGETITIDAGEGYTTYLWNTEEETQTIDILEPGNYFVTVSDVEGCEITDNFEVIDRELPYLNMSQDTTIYEGLSLCVSALDYLSVKMNDGNDGIEFIDASDYDLENDYTISVAFTINSNDAFENYGGLVAKGGGNDPSELDYSLYLWNDGTLRFMVQDENYIPQILASNQVLNLGEDYHVVVTKDDISTDLYINGVLDNSIEFPITPKNSLGELNIGRQLSDGYNDIMNCMSLYGVISHVRIWNTKFDLLDVILSQVDLYNDITHSDLIMDLNFSNNLGSQIYNKALSDFGNLEGLSNWSSQIPFEEQLMNGQTFEWQPTNETTTAISILPLETTTYICITNNEYCSNTQEITVTVEPIQNTSLGGQVIYSGGGIPGCKVKRYKLGDNGTYHYEEPMVYTDEFGYYNFPYTDPGIYILQAIGPNTYPNVLMTYYDSVHTWQLATPIPVLSGQNLDIIIVMRERLLKTLCEISGTIYYDDGAKFEIINKQKGTIPAEDITLLLNKLQENPFNPEDSDTYYKFFDGTISNQLGFYQFTEAEYGDYLNYPTLIEKPDILTENYQFTIEENNSTHQNLDFTIYSTEINITEIDQFNSENGVIIYPNPVISDYCTVGMNVLNAGNLKFEVYNSIGQLISVKEVISKSGDNSINLEIPDEAGLYFIRLSIDSEIKTLKIIRK